jgi:hypothetical protein
MQKIIGTIAKLSGTLASVICAGLAMRVGFANNGKYIKTLK